MRIEVLWHEIWLAVIVLGCSSVLFLTSICFSAQSPSIKLNPLVSSPAFKNIIAEQPIAPEQDTKLADAINSGLPIRLEIPAIKVVANLESVGLTSGGLVDVPKNQKDAAWYNVGPRPGEKGNAIITGHYGWFGNKPSAFDNLHKLRKGDKLLIENNSGEIITFVVRGNRRYNPRTDPLEVFVSNDGKAHLNLITCEGSWDLLADGYTTRLVVFADRE